MPLSPRAELDDAAARTGRRPRGARRADTWTLELDPLDGAGLAFAPGPVQHALRLRRRRGADLDQRRPGRGGALSHTMRAVGAVTRAICARRPGDVLGVRGPFGSAWPVEAAAGRDVVIVAGGIGLAPLRPAIYHALADRERYGRVVLLYGARTPDDLLYRERARALARPRRPRASRSPSTARARDWRGHVGVVTDADRRRARSTRPAVALVCGPEIMMRFAVAALRRARHVDASASASRWSATCSAASGTAATASSARCCVCRDGPVFRYDRRRPLMAVREL